MNKEKPPMLSNKEIDLWMEEHNLSSQTASTDKFMEAQRDADHEWLMSQEGVKLAMDSIIRYERQEVADKIFEVIDEDMHKPVGTYYFSCRGEWMPCGWYQALKDRKEKMK